MKGLGLHWTLDMGGSFILGYQGWAGLNTHEQMGWLGAWKRSSALLRHGQLLRQASEPSSHRLWAASGSRAPPQTHIPFLPL